MHLLTEEQEKKLVENYYHFDKSSQLPVVYLLAQEKDWYWLISELDPNTGQGFGITDLNDNQLKIGEINIEAIQALQDNGMTITNHPNFSTEYALAVFYEIGATIGKLVTSQDLLAEEFKDCQNKFNNRM